MMTDHEKAETIANERHCCDICRFYEALEGPHTCHGHFTRGTTLANTTEATKRTSSPSPALDSNQDPARDKHGFF